MSKELLFVLNGFLLVRGALSDFIHVDDTLNPGEVKQNQIFFNRKERFIKFDTKENELDIELGISIPFIKVPLTTGRELLEAEQPSEISINGPGVVIAGILMFTSFVLIPFLFTTQSLPQDSFGFQRRDDNNSNGFWMVLKTLDDLLNKSGIDSSSCVRKSICWIAKTTGGGDEGSFREWIHRLTNTWWFKFITGIAVAEESQHSDENSCGVQYSRCSLTPHNFQSFVKMIKTRRSGH